MTVCIIKKQGLNVVPIRRKYQCCHILCMIVYSFSIYYCHIINTMIIIIAGFTRVQCTMHDACHQFADIFEGQPALCDKYGVTSIRGICRFSILLLIIFPSGQLS
jgi:hypothetical protein